MKPFWHPLSAVLLPEPPTFATPAAVRMLLAGDQVELLYAGDRMAPTLRHGQRVVLRRIGEAPPRRGEVVLARAGGALDLLRVVGTRGGLTVLTADADPGPEVPVAGDDVLARALVSIRVTGRLQRTVRRLALDLREATVGLPDEGQDPATSVRRKYDLQAPFYSMQGGQELEAPLLARIRRLVPPGGRILVAGCGSGRECFALAAAGWRVVGVDFAPAMVELARREAARRGLTVEFCLADLRRHEEPRGSLAAVFFTYDVYSFLPTPTDRADLLRRMFQWLVADGVVFLSARRVRSAWDRVCLSVQWVARRRPRTTWGSSHTRWLTMDGTLRRSFIHVFTERTLRRELDGTGGTPENWEGGHLLVRRSAGAGG